MGRLFLSGGGSGGRQHLLVYERVLRYNNDIRMAHAHREFQAGDRPGTYSYSSAFSYGHGDSHSSSFSHCDGDSYPGGNAYSGAGARLYLIY